MDLMPQPAWLMDRNLQAVIDELLARYGDRWPWIGRDLETGGWRASRQVNATTWHHIVTRSLAELDRELAVQPGN